MALTTCAECKGSISDAAKSCPHCGHPAGEVWGYCPECKGAIAPDQAFCKSCGFPLRPIRKASAPEAPQSEPKGSTRQQKRRFGGGKGRPILEEAPEPPGAIIFAVLGVFFPILAIVGLAQSKKGSAAYILSWIDIGLWIAIGLFITAMRHH